MTGTFSRRGRPSGAGRVAIAAVAAGSLLFVGGSAGAVATGDRAKAADSTSESAKRVDKYAIPVKGKVKDENGEVVGRAKGHILKFKAKNQKLFAVVKVKGTADGEEFKEKGKVRVKNLSTSAAGANAAAQASCDILTLELGPLDLDLLGLVIHLDKVHLDITAVPGPGNLLGNLLCAIAGLFDADGFFRQVAVLLNQLLKILTKLGF